MKLAKTIPLQDLSIVTVARTMNVTPALIHYYIGGRDWLTSGIMNLFYKSLLSKWPEETGDWREDVVSVARNFFDHLSVYPGIAAYLVSNGRFRIFQMTAFGDRDYGLEAFEQLVGRLRKVGLSSERTAAYTNMLSELTINTAHRACHELIPKEHRRFLEERIAQLDPEKAPNIMFVNMSPILLLEGRQGFKEGIGLCLLGMEHDRRVEGVADEPVPDKVAS